MSSEDRQGHRLVLREPNPLEENQTTNILFRETCTTASQWVHISRASKIKRCENRSYANRWRKSIVLLGKQRSGASLAIENIRGCSYWRNKSEAGRGTGVMTGVKFSGYSGSSLLYRWSGGAVRHDKRQADICNKQSYTDTNCLTDKLVSFEKLVIGLKKYRITIFYYTTHEILSENMGFGSAKIQRYYTAQQLIAQLRQWAVKRQLNTAE